MMSHKSVINPLGQIPGLSIMDRYILLELLMPFVFGVVAFSSIGVSIGVLFYLMRMITEAGLPVSVAAQVFLLRLPYFVGLAFPMSMLLACLMVYGRLSSDSEFVAMRSCGVSVYRLVLPAVLLGLVVSGINFTFNEAVVPICNRQAAVLLDRALDKREPTFREKDILYQQFDNFKDESGKKTKRLARLFYAREFDGQQMRGLTILDFTQKGVNQIISSDAAIWNSDQQAWDFFKGVIYGITPKGDQSELNILRFQQQRLQLPRDPLDIAKTTKDPAEMNIAEAEKYLKLIQNSGNEKEIRKIRLRIEEKRSFPFACLVFGLVGSTLGVRSQRTGRGTSFGISLILIVGYYLFISVCQTLYSFDFMTAVMAAWVPTLTAIAAGGWLLWKRNQ